MNRHQSNPFLSDWDDDEVARPLPGQSIFDAPPDLQEDSTAASANPRRSSCSQMGATGGVQSATGQTNRQGLYRRNMSSFEAASTLQYEHELQQNGKGGVQDEQLLRQQRELIAKMTADFQSAIETSDKQFGDDLEATPNPFDPFETIVDDDSLPLASPGTGADRDFPDPPERPSGLEGAAEARAPSSTRLHESIDDDEDELVSTPVRNIKSSPTPANHFENASSYLEGEQANGEFISHVNASNDLQTSLGQDSIAKAALFASLLASAENTTTLDGNASNSGDQQTIGLDGKLSGFSNDEKGDNQLGAAATSHVIKGSPTAADGSSERPVSFFDPFETVIDRDALTSLVSEQRNHQSSLESASSQSNSNSNSHSHSHSNELRAGGARVAESASIETVIENVDQLRSPSPIAEQVERKADHLLGEQDDQKTPEESQQQRQQQQQTAAINRYDASIALARPSQRKLQTSGITPPQPTPAKRPLKPAAGARVRVQKRNLNGEAELDSSSSSEEEDERIKVVIRARDPNASTANDGNDSQQQQPILVPLLPPPPSKSSMKQARERGQVEDMPSPLMGYKTRRQQSNSDSEAEEEQEAGAVAAKSDRGEPAGKQDDEEDGNEDDEGQFVIQMRLSDNEEEGEYAKPETPLYDEDTSYVLDDYPPKYDGPGWAMMLRYPPKKKLTANRFWKRIFVKLAQVPLAPESSASSKKAAAQQQQQQADQSGGLGWALQIFEHQDDRKAMQEIPIQATYTVSEISSQLFDQFGKIFTIKLQYIFYKERVGVRQGQLARFIHSGHIGSSTTSGGHGVDPISIGAIKRMGAPIEHSPQISQIIKLGCTNYDDMRTFKEALEDCLFRIPITRERALTTYKTEEVQMAVRDETYIEINQIGTITRQLARVRLFFLSFLNGTPLVEVGVNEIHRQGREVVGRMDILPVITEEWIRLEAWQLHSTVDGPTFEDEQSRLIKLTPPDATFFELMRFRMRPPRNRELPLQISANMTVTRTRVTINCDVMVPGCVSRKHGQIPCENIAIRVHIPECWIYFFREEKHFRMGSKKSVNRRPGKVKGIERFLGGGGGGGSSQGVLGVVSGVASGAGPGAGGLNEPGAPGSGMIEVTSGQAKYEHHHQAIVWRAARWPKESQAAYVQNSMKIKLPLTAYDKMPDSFYEFVHVEYTMPATTVSHTTLRSIAVSPCDDEPPEKYVKYAAKYEYKVKMRLSVNLNACRPSQQDTTSGVPEASPIVIMKARANNNTTTSGGGGGLDPDDGLEREKDEDDDDDDDDDDDEEEEVPAGNNGQR